MGRWRDETYQYGHRELKNLRTPERISKLIYPRRENYDKRERPGRHNGWIEPIEVNTVIAIIDFLEALNRLSWREYRMLNDYYWMGKRESSSGLWEMMERYGYCTEEKLQMAILGIRRKLSRWMNGQWPEYGKPALKRFDTLSEMIEKIF